MAPAQKLENENAFKHLFNKQLLQRIAESLGAAWPAFPKRQLLSLMPALEPLEMKPRVRFIAESLRALLPQNYAEALKILRDSGTDGALEGFALWPYTDFIQTYGLEMPAESLAVLAQLTPRFTAEWAVRPFLRQDAAKTLKFLLRCAGDENEHLRRWASEGSRPRLPWGERLHDFIAHPESTLPILEKLKYDDALYVRKSVANHLNDIAKDHPALVVKILARWRKEAPAMHEAKIGWITRHALRSLIKAGHKDALKLIGVAHGAAVHVTGLAIAKPDIRLGGSLDFAFDVQSDSARPQKLVIDYIVHFVKASKNTAPKVFKLKTLELAAGEKRRIAKSHAVKKITTRQYHAGAHLLEIQVNGVVLAKKQWQLAL